MSNIGPIKAYYDAKSIHEVEPHLERIKSGLFQGFMQSHPIGYWQFHQFKYKPGMSFVKASYAECFMHLLVECQANCRPETCFLVIYSGQRGPFGKPSHCITLISKGDKLYNMGQKKATGPTQRDMVRIIPRDKGDGKKILCFSVGKKEHISVRQVVEALCQTYSQRKKSFDRCHNRSF